MSFLGLLIIVMGLGAPDHTEVVKPRNHKWIMNPVVRVCVDSGVTPPRISNALAYWQRLGYKFDYTRIDYSVPCPDARFGEIIIMLPDNTFSFEDNLASTRITVSNETKEIVKAKIFIFPNAATKERVLEHEIGHALGWPHINRPYHIMNSNWHTGGHNSSGLKLKLFYKKYID